MEDRNEEGGHVLYEYRNMNLQEIGKRSVKWDLNDWKWDGDLFVASQLNRETMGRQFFPLGNSSNSSSSCSDGGIGSHELMGEKKRRAVAIEEDNNNGGNLTLKLGDNNGGVKKTKLCGNGSNHPVCQVENCEADLSKVKDYHRRHKVCQMHSKATSAIVGGIVQRFCQQCSRFHVLEEFDEGKRSCRRRLAGHNKRRRKTNPETVTNGNPSSDDHQSRNYALITLLKIISNMYSNQPNQTGDQDLLSHVLKSLVSLGGEQMEKNLIGHLQGRPQASMNNGNSALLAPQEDLKQVSVDVPETPRQEVYVNGSNRTEKQVKVNDFDLNDTYIDSDDGTDGERSSPPINPATSSHDYPTWIRQDSHQSSPPQTSRNSDSDQSPSSISGDAHCRTGRIEIKLFGKAPNDFPVVLRGEILDWLSHSPTDIESYIRPGCVILTIYLRQAEAAWEELCDDLGFSLRRLLDLTNDPLWTTGWIYVRVQNQMAFVFNGHVVVDTFLPLRSSDHSHIISVRPIAVATTTRKVQFTVKGINLHRSDTRLLCALEGKYLFQESTHENDDHKENNEMECVKFSCEMPLTKGGRGFMEIEDQGLSSSFFPFIVVEDDVCSEIRVLESTLEFIGTDSAKQAMEFIYEIGWLLHRSKLKSRFGESYPNTDEFSLKRFKWLIEFSMDREWCAVIRHLLNTFFEGVVGSEEGSSIDATLSELCLLHRAVRKNSKPMVEMLLRYVPKQQRNSRNQNSLFRPDATGPAGLTPLHIAAGKDGSEDVLDALTEDPAMVGIEAWKTSKDNTGFTPEDYARLRGHFSYIHLVQRKLNKKSSGEDHVVVSIPILLTDVTTDENEEKEIKTGLVSSTMEIAQSNCKLCDHKLAYRTRSRSLAYRPAMLSMVAIAAVCVCVALLFKSCPEVLYVFQPFRWELLDYGTS